MIALQTALQELADAMTAADVPATSDPATVVTPGALIGPNLIDFERLTADAYTLTVDIYLIAGDVGVPGSLETLNDLLLSCLALWPLTEVRAVSLSLPNYGPDPLPALTFQIIVDVQEGE